MIPASLNIPASLTAILIPAAGDTTAAEHATDNASRLTPLHQEELVVFWVQLLVLVAMARFLGYVMYRVGLPSVIGHLTAGVILGPSVFGKVWETGFKWFIPATDISSGALSAVTWIGVALLLVTAGFETDLELIRRLGRAAMLVTGFSLLLPLLGGLVTGFMLPDSFVAENADRNVFAMFVASALSVSALAVIARILSELGLMRRDFGQITVAAGMANDVVGWVMLAVFTGFATGGVSVTGTLKTVIGLTLFLAMAMTLGQRAVDYSLREVRRSDSGVMGAVSVVVFTMLTFGVITQVLGIEAVLGAFVAGVILHRSRFQQHEVIDHIESLTHAFFAPLFFATAGIKVDLWLLADRRELIWAGVVVAVAVSAKFVGSFVGAKLAGQTNRAAAALGAGLNARGTLEIVIASVGLSAQVFSPTAYTVIVIIPLLTSIFAAVSLQVIVRDWRGTADEQERLDREEALGRNLVVRSERLLLASRAQPASIAASQILHFAWPVEVPVSVTSVASDDPDDDSPGKPGESGWPDITVIRNVLYERAVDHQTLQADDVAHAIVDESRLGYGVICVGVAERHEGQLYSPMVDELLLHSTLPVLIVRRALGLDTPLPGVFARAVVPVTGTRSSRAAQEIAFGISGQLGTEIVLTHVITHHGPSLHKALGKLGGRHKSETPGDGDSGDPVIDSLMTTACDLGAKMGAFPVTEIRHGVFPGTSLVEATVDTEADLVVLGASLRNVDGRPFLGQTVETVLEQCEANVVVVAMPRTHSTNE